MLLLDNSQYSLLLDPSNGDMDNGHIYNNVSQQFCPVIPTKMYNIENFILYIMLLIGKLPN